MSVQITNASLAVRRVEPSSYDAHGAEVPGAPSAPGPAMPGKVTEASDGRWQLALDPALWPVRVGDVVVDGEGTQWRVLVSQLIRSPDVPEAPAWAGELDVSFVRVTAAQVVTGGTEPGGGEFVGR